MTNMGSVTPFSIIVIALLSMQFATSNGTLLCFGTKYAQCYQTLIQTAVQQRQCQADDSVRCLKNTADQCDINNSTNAGAMGKILEMEKMLYDLCEEGSDLNTAFLKHKDCVFGPQSSELVTQCYGKLIEKLSKYQKSGNTQKDLEALFKMACPFIDGVAKCVRSTIQEACGEEAAKFQRKLSDPATGLEEIVCNSSPAPIGSFWTVLLQASVILMSLQFFRLKE